MDKKTYTIARITAFIISCVLAYALWTFIRPRFVTPITPQEIVTNSEPKEQPTEQTEHLTQTLADENVQIEHPSAQKETPKAIKKNSIPAQKTSPIETSPLPASLKPVFSVPEKSTQVTPSTTAHRTVTIHNGIEKKMLGYKKFGTHYPTYFKVTVGEKTLEQGESFTTPIENNTLVIRYDFEFMNGYRNGAKEVTFTLKSDAEKLTLAFNWKGEHRLLFAETEKVAAIVEKDVPYQA